MAEIYTYDIEVYPNYFLCGVKRHTDGKVALYRIAWVPSKVEGVDAVEYNDLDKIVKLFANRKRWFCGWNSFEYDDQIMAFIIEHYREFQLKEPAHIAADIYAQNVEIIERNNKDYKYHAHFQGLDMMRMGRKGNQRKSLKRTGVSVKHWLVQDLPIPPGSTIYQEDMKEVEDYNVQGDIAITYKAYCYFKGDIALRRNVSLAYQMNLMNEGGHSGIASKLLLQALSRAKGIEAPVLREMRTERKSIPLRLCIPEHIKFRTKLMQEFLEELRETVIYPSQKFKRRIRIGETYYDVMTGGLHSVNTPTIYRATEEVQIKDCDVSSFYPFLILNNGVAPAHLGNTFTHVYSGVVAERMEAKASGDKLKADNLKIVVNAGYGQMGSPYSFMYDPLALYRVTIPGQLSLLMLIERLEEVGIRVFYANTDGITALVPVELEDEYTAICEEWQSDVDFQLEFEDYRLCVIRNVNNYLIVKTSGDVKAKGMMDRDAWKNLSDKMQFKYPIVPHALHEYFVNGVPVEKTIKGHKDLHDFCMAQKVGPTYDDVWFRQLDAENARETITRVQRTNRYFVTDNTEHGGVLQKIKFGKDEKGKKSKDLPIPTNVCSGELVCLANNMKLLPPGVKPKYSWYVKEVRKVIHEFEGQLSLFG